MPETDEILWKVNTASAKMRFDEAYNSNGGPTAENMLFLTIMRHAHEWPADKILADLSGQFLLRGWGGDKATLRAFIEDSLVDLRAKSETDPARQGEFSQVK